MGVGSRFQSPEHYRAASMTPQLEKIKQRLREWQEAMQAVEGVVSDLMQIVGHDPEAPLHSTVSALQGLATRQMAEIIGASEDWLEAWWLEHNFGERPLQIAIAGEPLREIKNIEELAQVIYDDLQAPEKESQ